MSNKFIIKFIKLGGRFCEILKTVQITLHQRCLTFISFQLCKLEIQYESGCLFLCDASLSVCVISGARKSELSVKEFDTRLQNPFVSDFLVFVPRDQVDA